MSNPCFVLGLFDTGLAVVRALGRAGVPVFGFDFQPGEYGFQSRYGTHTVCPHPSAAADLIGCLRERARPFAAPPILYPTSDAFVAFVSEYRDVLERDFRYVLPSREAVACALDKSRQYARAEAAGVPVPETHVPRTYSEVLMLADTLDYPVVVKPTVGHRWRETYSGDKAVRVESARDLARVYLELLAAGQTALTQRVIAGPNTNHYKVCGYFDRTGQPLALMCMRKLRQYPVDFGVGTLMESVHEPELQALGLRLFQALEWRGPGSIEFKRDARDGGWKLIELNPRLWQQNALAASCGMNFPVLQYLEVAGVAPQLETYHAGVRWLDEFRDPRSAWEQWRSKRLTLAQWTRSLTGIKVRALWAADDPAPFLAAVRRHAARASQRVRRAPEPSLAESA